jgi:hypothetical protein
MTRNKKPPSSSAQLSFARELFAAPRPEAPKPKLVIAESNERDATALVLPTNPNSFGYRLHIFQNDKMFKRALIWRIVDVLLSSGVVSAVVRMLFFQ